MSGIRCFGCDGLVYDKVTYSINRESNGRYEFASEYIGSSLIKKLYGSSQDVRLTSDGTNIKLELSNFLPTNYLFVNEFKFRTIHEINKELGDRGYSHYNIQEVYDALKNIRVPDIHRKVIKEQFWDMFIFDAILGNAHRTEENWGYFVDSSGCYHVSNLFANEYCLAIQEEWRDADLERKKELLLRNLIIEDSEIKENQSEVEYLSIYKSVLENASKDSIFEERLERIQKAFTVKEIEAIIFKIVTAIDFLENWEQEYYIYVVVVRYAYMIQCKSFQEIWDSIKDYL